MTAKIGEVDEVATNVAAISEEKAASSMEIMASSEAMVEQARQLSNCSQEIAEDAEKLAVTYGEENGYDISVEDGYIESNGLLIRRFNVKKK